MDYAVFADWDFNLRCWALTRFKYIDLVVAKFYAGGISTSKRVTAISEGYGCPSWCVISDFLS